MYRKKCKILLTSFLSLFASTVYMRKKFSSRYFTISHGKIICWLLNGGEEVKTHTNNTLATAKRWLGLLDLPYIYVERESGSSR